MCFIIYRTTIKGRKTTVQCRTFLIPNFIFGAIPLLSFPRKKHPGAWSLVLGWGTQLSSCRGRKLSMTVSHPTVLGCFFPPPDWLSSWSLMPSCLHGAWAWVRTAEEYCFLKLGRKDSNTSGKAFYTQADLIFRASCMIGDKDLNEFHNNTRKILFIKWWEWAEMFSVPELPKRNSSACVLFPYSDGDAAKPARAGSPKTSGRPVSLVFVPHRSHRSLYQWRQ